MEGGQGNVEIVHGPDNSEYACKHLLHPKNSYAIARFNKEIRIIEKINHPNVIKVLRYGTDTKGPYYCMPRYAVNLRQFLRNELFSDFRKQYLILTQIINGVKALHENGIIHRDLKPENILLNNYDDLVICDFGLSKDLTSDSASLTGTGLGIGTRFYMSPEQYNDSKRVDFRTDIFALGKIMYDIIGINHGFHTEEVLKRVANKACSHDKDDRHKDIMTFEKAVREAYEFLLQKQNEKNVGSILNNIAVGGYSDEVLVEYISIVLDSKTYIAGYACDVLTGLQKKQYVYIENNYFDLCMDIHRQIWEDYKNTWGNNYLKVDEMVNTAEYLINVSESSKIKGYILANLSEFAFFGNRYTAMAFIANSLSEMVSDSDFIRAFLSYANKFHVKSIFKNIGRTCPTWIR